MAMLAAFFDAIALFHQACRCQRARDHAADVNAATSSRH